MDQRLITTIELIFGLATYIITAYPLYVMGTKINSSHPWFAWVPILNLVLMIEIAGKDLWWIILCLIPCVNIFVFIAIWMGIAEAMNKPSWLGILMIIPGVSWILPFYFAFG